MKTRLLLFLFTLFCVEASFASEAMRYAKHGCKVERNATACKVFEGLKRLKNKPAQTDYGYISSTQNDISPDAKDFEGRKIASSDIEIEDNSTYDEKKKTLIIKNKIKSDGFEIENNIKVVGYDAKKAMAQCKSYGEKLKGCQQFSCKYLHPFGGMEMEKRIIGFDNGKCKTEEEMPNNGLMTCLYSKDKLSKASEFTDSMGKKHADSMNKWMNDGTCEISGY